MTSWVLAATFGARDPSEPARAVEAATGKPPRRLGAGPLSVAATGDVHAPAEDASLCAIAGTIYDYARPARAAGLDPALPAAELLARAHARVGDRVLEGLRGDFCLILYDPVARAGVIARDHMGGLPVYWQDRGGVVQVATDPRVALAMNPSRPGPDIAALSHWISLSGLPADRTLYAGLGRLPAGHLLRLREGQQPRRERYWTPRYGPRREGTRAELVAGLHTQIQTAVARRSSGGAVLLSGGVDSSTVAAFASTQRPRTIQSSYSAVFPDHPTVDETAQIDNLGDTLDLDSVRAEVRSGSVIESALTYLERFEIPPISPNLFFWIPLFERAAADGVSALLDGEGGDELFGLSPLLIADRLRRGRFRAARRLIDNVPGAGGNAPDSAVKYFMREYGYRGALPGWVQLASRRFHGPDRYTQPFLLEPTKRAFMTALDEVSWKKIPGPRWWSYLVDITTRGMGPAFVYEHVALRARMAGIEARHPLVDADVIEYILSLPPEAAWDPQRSRPLMRETTAGVLPDQVRLRSDKSSFDAVFHAALAGPDLPVLRTLLDGPDARMAEFVDIAMVKRDLLDPGAPEHAKKRQDWAIKVWRLATAELWLRLQEDRDAPRALLEAANLPAAEVTLASRSPRKSAHNA